MNGKVKDKADAARDKLADKLPDKLSNKVRKKKAAPLKITNDTIAEHREQILAGGRKFKYPLQYSKHKILINAVAVAVVAVVFFSVWLWVMLYRVQATSDFFYNTTRILPLPVARVDGEWVRYSDYLRRIRADIFYYENQESKNFQTEDGQRELDYNKRRELTATIRAAYATKIARENNVSVSTAEIDAKIKAQREADNSDEATLIRMLRAYYNWTLDEYRQTIRDQLLEQKVAFAIDNPAKERVAKVEERLRSGEDFAEIAKEVSDDPIAKETGGIMIAREGDSDGMGLIAAARSLDEGQFSGPIASLGRNVDGNYCYFIVKLESKTDSETRYSVITINLAQFDKDFARLGEQGKIREFIRVPEL
ncbi:SurA N-terminal domain-containing protein [Candidatus Saccharibacteria bacterium]|nr:SurA N-terminal domain-containing protein [Candidatus Saccharibacteria bacterium]